MQDSSPEYSILAANEQDEEEESEKEFLENYARQNVDEDEPIKKRVRSKALFS